MTDFKRWLIMAPVAAGFIAATACAASAQQPDRQPGFLDNLFGGSERLAPSPEPAQGQYQGQGQGQGRQERSNELMVRLERLEGQIRQLTGAIEELQHRNQQLEAQLQDVRGGVPRAATGAVVPPAAARPTMAPPVTPAPAAAAPGRRGDVFDPAQNPTAPGAPHVLGSPASASVPLPQGSEPNEQAAAGPGGAPLDLSTLSEAAARDPSLATPGRMASGGQGSPAPARGPSGGEQLATLPPSDSPKDNFDLAYGYVMRKDYALAQDGFRSFLTRFPNDRLAPDAYYWLGESLFQSQQYRDAAESFLTVSTKYETTGRAPEALLRLGQSLAALGEKEAACASLGEVLRKYPRASVGVKQGVDREQKRARC
jgi:tol-pal system protein YbgF